MNVITWREIREADLTACLDLHPGNMGDEIVGRQTALQIWRELLRNSAFHGIVVESDSPVDGHRIVSCGAGVFVSADFMTCEIAHPRPGLNARVIASLAQGDSVLLTRDDVGRANAGAGIDIVNMQGSWLQQGLTADQVAEINAALAASFMEVHRGYRLNRLLRELPCEAELEAARAFFQVIATFPELDRSTVLLTGEHALSAPYSMISLMFQYQEPVLRLGESDQQLLAAALNGQTDGELSVALDLSVAAIKKRWLSIFARIANGKPALLGIPAPDADLVRGRQKRHHVLSYIRAHHEELRPFPWNDN